MLKLEKAKHRDVCITMRNKERWFNSTLLYALGIACGIHFLGVIIVHIHPFISHGDKILPPTLVEAEMSNQLEDDDWNVLAYLDTKHKASRYLFAPIASEPKLPSMSIDQPLRPTEYIKEPSLLDNPFMTIEEDWDYFYANELFAQASQPPVSVHVSGPLAESPLLDDGTTTISPTELTTILQQSQRCVYSVQVEGKTGRIFWFASKHTPDKQSICNMAESLLLRMRFQPNANTVVSAGEVEITLSPSGGA